MISQPSRLLSVSPYCVYPPVFGGPKRIFYLNRGLARNGWRVFQFSGSTKREGGLHTLLSASREIAPGYTEHRYFNPFLHYFNRALTRKSLPMVGFSLFPRALVNPGILQQQIDRHDVIMLEHPYLFRQVQARVDSKKLIALNAHNIEFQLFESSLDSAGLKGKLVRHLFELEKACFRGVDLIFVCSEDDKAAAVSYFDVDAARIHVAPNGVDVGSVSQASVEQRLLAKQSLGLENRHVALFIGSRWQPNTEAVRALLKIADDRDDVHYLVVGGVGADFSDVQMENVTVTGYVDALDPYLAAADIAVNPMVSGSGSNIKMFEYLAAGLPVVTTSFGARGIEVDDGDAILATEMTSIPDRIALVAAEGDVLVRRRHAARSLAERRYDWTSISRGISDILKGAR